uniref:adenine phosphoribosyltransferase n=1 Tax=Ficedula albicollis TaxID=59894 RepID=A0A803VR49_FICAL
MDLCHVPATREKGWYLALMAPNVKGPNYAWLDPSRLYCHPQVPSARGGWHPPGARVGCISTGLLGHPAVGAHGGLQAPSTSPLPQGLQDCVADLLQPFQGDAIDMVAGIDAMGFILGAAAAATLQKGFLAIRKAGHLCVQTAAQPYSDYSGRGKVMEVRTDAITPGLRILLVDQWVETGGTMRAAIELVERLGGVVAGRRRCTHGCSGTTIPIGWVASEPPCVSPQVSLPSAWRAAREGSGSRSATSAPTVSPPACSPTSTSTTWAGTDVGLAPRVPPAAPSRDTGLLALQDRDAPRWKKELILRGGHPSSCLPMSLGAAPRARETHNQLQPPVPSPTPFLQSIKKVLLRQKGA